jgi:hypothetical protein
VCFDQKVCHANYRFILTNGYTVGVMNKTQKVLIGLSVLLTLLVSVTIYMVPPVYGRVFAEMGANNLPALTALVIHWNWLWMLLPVVLLLLSSMSYLRARRPGASVLIFILIANLLLMVVMIYALYLPIFSIPVIV